MKKILLLALVMISGVMTANADVELYLHNSSNWSAYPAFTNKGTNPNNSSEVIWEYTLNSSTGLSEGVDFYFRLKYSDYNDDLGPNWCKNEGNNYTYQWKDGNSVYNGKWETYEIKHATNEGQNFWGGSSAFCIAHSTIKASEYRITVYANRGNSYFVKVEIVSMPLTISDASGYATFSCDRALDFSTAGVTAYVASAPTSSSVSMVPVSGVVPANTGLFIKGTASETPYEIPVVTTSSASNWNQTNYLHPTPTSGGSEAAVDAGNYVLARQGSEVGFYQLGASTMIGEGKAYLSTSVSGARLSIAFDEKTSISSIKSDKAENVYYDIQGRRVAQTTKGLYIVNGKKVIK